MDIRTRDDLLQLMQGEILVIPKGSRIYRGAESHAHVRNVPAFYGPYSSALKYHREGTQLNCYVTKRELNLVGSTRELIQELCGHFSDMGCQMTKALILISLPPPDISMTEVSAAIKLLEGYVPQLVKLATKYGSREADPHDIQGILVALKTDLKFVPSRVSFRPFDQIIAGLYKQTVGRRFDGIYHINDQYLPNSLCKMAEQHIMGILCVEAEIGIFNGLETLTTCQGESMKTHDFDRESSIRDFPSGFMRISTPIQPSSFKELPRWGQRSEPPPFPKPFPQPSGPHPSVPHPIPSEKGWTVVRRRR